MIFNRTVEFLASLPNDIFWLFLSGFIFLVMALVFLIGPYRQEKDELMDAFIGFLGGMSLFHLFGGLSMLLGNPFLMYIGSFGALTGSAFIVKFPLLSVSNRKLRQTSFYVALALGWLLIVWMFISNSDIMTSMRLASIYMIVFSGLSGAYIIWKGFQFPKLGTRIKCVGGGSSIWFCCFLTHSIVLTVGMIGLAKIFMVLTPVTLVLAVLIGRSLSHQDTPLAV